MTVEKAKKEMIRIGEEVKQLIASAPTPEIRHELATDFLKWIKKQQQGEA